MAETVLELVIFGISDVCNFIIVTVFVVCPAVFVAITVNCTLPVVVGVPLTVAPFAVNHDGKLLKDIVGAGVPFAVAV